MKQTARHYLRMFQEDGITTVYSGPLWPEGIEGLAEMLQTRLRRDELPPPLSQSIFSIFIEQMNNMLMHSCDADCGCGRNGDSASKGTFILGATGRGYFLQTGNVVDNGSVEAIRRSIDHLNTLDEAGLRKLYREKLRTGGVTPDHRGAGLGLIEIARRASSKIEYSFMDHGEGVSFFEMYVTIGEVN